jgi:hypothetical protein
MISTAMMAVVVPRLSTVARRRWRALIKHIALNVTKTAKEWLP